ncbi:MAG: S-layer homology domain-containing protein, partial [Ruminococcaceae bacterium]|nr:S-layer homology domain-containing protein [Oscillospiraceae bacterium]
RYAEFKGIDTASAYDLSDFADASSVKAYATSAFAWAVENGIINGMDGRLAPTATSTRAQIATILMRFMEM